MPDDIELYNRCQEGNATRGGEWVSMHRYHGTDRSDEQGMVSVSGTSELPMRNQFRAWRDYRPAPWRWYRPRREKAHAARPGFRRRYRQSQAGGRAGRGYHRIAQFLYREARLLDERRYADWHALWTEDGMDAARAGAEVPDHVSLFWEDRMLRDVRIRRLEHPRNWSQQPPTRSARLVGGADRGRGRGRQPGGAFGLPDDRVAQAPAAPAGRTLHQAGRRRRRLAHPHEARGSGQCDDAHDAFEVFV